MLQPHRPALVLAPMEGITDAPMRALWGETGCFSYAVTEFLRVSAMPLTQKELCRDVPELDAGCMTPSGLPVQVQLLGGDPDRMAQSALRAIDLGARGIDLNFGCPAKTVNRHDGGAALLRDPKRLGAIVKAVRQAVPARYPVSAKLRLGWDSIEPIDENARIAGENGASWITIHARTRTQGYQPPVNWEAIGRVRSELMIPVIANGDIWTLEDLKRCAEVTGACHFMIGRSALADPLFPYQASAWLGIDSPPMTSGVEWSLWFKRLLFWTDFYSLSVPARNLARLKQWANFARLHGQFEGFDRIKTARSVEEFFGALVPECAKVRG